MAVQGGEDRAKTVQRAKDQFTKLQSLLVPSSTPSPDARNVAQALQNDLRLLTTFKYERPPAAICKVIGHSVLRFHEVFHFSFDYAVPYILFMAEYATQPQGVDHFWSQIVEAIVVIILNSPDKHELASAIATDFATMMVDTIHIESLLNDPKFADNKELGVPVFEKLLAFYSRLSADITVPLPLGKSKEFPLASKDAVLYTRRFCLLVFSKLLSTSGYSLTKECIDSVVLSLWSLLVHSSDSSLPNAIKEGKSTSHLALDRISSSLAESMSPHTLASVILRGYIDTASTLGRVPRRILFSNFNESLRIFPRQSELSFECLSEISVVIRMLFLSLEPQEQVLFGVRIIENVNSAPNLSSIMTNTSRLSKFEAPLSSTKAISQCYESGIAQFKRTLLSVYVGVARNNTSMLQDFDFLIPLIGDFCIQDQLIDAFILVSRKTFRVPQAPQSSQVSGSGKKRKYGEEVPQGLSKIRPLDLDAMDLDEPEVDRMDIASIATSASTNGFISKLFILQNHLKFESSDEHSFLKSSMFLEVIIRVAVEVEGAVGLLPFKSLISALAPMIAKIVSQLKAIVTPSATILVSLASLVNSCRCLLVNTGQFKLELPLLERLFELVTFALTNKWASYHLDESSPFFEAVLSTSLSALTFVPSYYKATARLEIFKELLNEKNPKTISLCLRSIPMFVLRYGNDCLPVILPALHRCVSIDNPTVLELLVEIASFIPAISQSKPVVDIDNPDYVQLTLLRMWNPGSRDTVVYRSHISPPSSSTTYIPLVTEEDPSLIDRGLAQERPSDVIRIRALKTELPTSLSKRMKYEDFLVFLAVAKQASSTFEGARSSLCRLISRVFHYCAPDPNLNDYYETSLQLLQDSSMAVRHVATLIWPSFTKLGTARVDQFLHDLRELFSKYSGKREFQSSLLVAYGLIATFVDQSQLMVIMLFLTDRLVDKELLNRGIAFDQISFIARSLKLRPGELIEKFKDTLYPLIAQFLVHQYEVADEVCSALLDCSADQFLRANIRLVLPNLFYKVAKDPNHEKYPADLLKKIATLLGKERVSDMVIDYLDVIISFGTMNSMGEIIALLEKIYPSIPFHQLLSSCAQNLALDLTWKLGDADQAKRDKARVGLFAVAKLLMNDVSPDAVANFMEKEHFLFIVHTLKFSLIRREEPLEKKIAALKAMEVLVELIQMHLSKFSLKVISLLKAVKEFPHLMKYSIGVWEKLIKLSEVDIVHQLLSDIVVELIPYCEHEVSRSRAVGLCTYIFKENRESFKGSFSRLCFLPDDIPGLGSFVKSIPELNVSNLGDVIKQLLPVLEEDGSTVRIYALKRLVRLIREPFHSKALFGMIQSEPIHSDLKSLVKAVLKGTSDREVEVRRVSAELIGSIGAIDPQKIDMVLETLVQIRDIRELSDDELAVALLETELAPLYKNASSDSIQDKAAYSIQELLRACKCDQTAPNFDKKNPPANKPEIAWKVWVQLRQETADIVAPFLTSRYTDKSPKAQYPKIVFSESISYNDWVVMWTRKMIDNSDSPILKIVLDEDISIAHFLIPHVVVRLLTSQNEAARQQLKDEITSILMASEVDDNRILETPSKSVRSKSSFQMITQRILLLIDYLYSFLDLQQKNDPKKIDSRSARHKSRALSPVVNNLTELLDSIPQLTLSHASYRCQAYARTLLHYEEHIRRKIKEKHEAARFDYKTSSLALEFFEAIVPDVAYLQKVYAGLNEPDAIYGLMNASDSLSVEEQTAQCESMEDWLRALNGYSEALIEREKALKDLPDSETTLLRRQDDLSVLVSLHHGRLKCLLHLGRFQDAIDISKGLLSDKRLDFAHKSIRSYAIQSAWRLGDWDSVSHLLGTEDKPELLCEPTFDTSVAAILLALRKEKTADIPRLLTSARDLVLAPLTAASMDSYNRAYFGITELHVLSDLEMASNTRRGDPSEGIALWNNRLGITQRSFSCREPILYARVHIADYLKQPQEIQDRWIEISKLSRVANLLPRSSFALHMARAAGVKDERYALEHSKLLWASGNQHMALQELQHQTAHFKVNNQEPSPNIAVSQLSVVAARRVRNQQHQNMRTANPANEKDAKLDENQEELFLCLLKWIKESGLDQVRQMEQMFVTVTKNKNSKSFFRYAKHLDDQITRLKTERKNDEQSTHANLLPTCITNYGLACIYGNNYVYQCLPRLLTLVLDYFDEIIRDKERQVTTSSQIAVTDSVLQVTQKVFKRITAAQLMLCFSQITSRVLHKKAEIVELLEGAIVKCFDEFPYQSIWQFVGFMKYLATGRRKLYSSIRDKVKSSVPQDARHNDPRIKVWDEAERLVAPMEVLSKYHLQDGFIEGPNDKAPSALTIDHIVQLWNKQKPQQAVNFSCSHSSFQLVIPMYQFLTINLPEAVSMKASASAHVTIERIKNALHMFSSKQKPKKFTIQGSDGKTYELISKYGDDLRKDSRVMDLGGVVNKLFKKNPESNQRLLNIRTYACTPLGEAMGLIEVVPDVTPLRDVIFALYKEGGYDLQAMRKKATEMYTRQEHKDDPILPVNDFLELRNDFAPVFYKWFIRNFPDPAQWFRAKINYAHSVAVMSMFGYIVGLGDRHGENLLCEAKSGAIVHVDFGCLFWMGQLLPVAETVPFRLTHNMVDAFGITGVEGTFRRSCEVTLQLLRHHKDILKATLEAYVHDPLLDWTKTKSGGQQPDIPKAEKLAMSHYMGIEDRLNGKLRDLMNSSASKSNRVTTALIPLTVQAQVEALLDQATSPENLRRLYKGWASYI